MGRAARESAERFAWPRVAARVERVYERAHRACPQPPTGSPERAAARFGWIAPPTACRAVPAERMPLARAAAARPAARAGAASPAASASASAALVGLGLTYLAAQQIGIDNVVESAVRSDLAWVLVATALMCLSMFFRAGAWYLTAPLGAARSDAAPPRLHLGDDDRRADVGDAAGPPRRARAGDDHRPPDRPRSARRSRSCSARSSRRRSSTSSR